jgi:hypothetical protein
MCAEWSLTSHQSSDCRFNGSIASSFYAMDKVIAHNKTEKKMQ